MQNRQKSIQACLILCCSLDGISYSIAQAENTAIEALSPASQLAALHQEPSPKHAEEPYVNRIGLVTFAVDTFLPKAVQTGARVASSRTFLKAPLPVAFFTDKQFTIVVAGESRPCREVLSLTGKIEGQEISTFTMTVTPESYLISLQDLQNATVFRVVGNTESGLGQVAEIDLRKMPPKRYLPPLIPEGE